MNRNQQTQKRQRLTPKQRQFLHRVYDLGEPITAVLNDLHVRVLTFERWLTKPIFINRLRMYISQFYLQARLEMARSAPSAISGLTRLTEKNYREEEMRKACSDILNIHTQFAKIAASKPAQNGAALDNFGALLAQFGASLAHNGACLADTGTQKTPQNRILGPENAENVNRRPRIPSEISAAP
jgi:hypothetical protein